MNFKELEYELNKIRRTGYAIDNEEYMEGIRCVGSPILNHLKIPIATIGVSGPKQGISINKAREYGKLISKISMEVSQHFGYFSKSTKIGI